VRATDTLKAIALVLIAAIFVVYQSHAGTRDMRLDAASRARGGP